MEFIPYESKAPYADLLESVFHYRGFLPDHSIERVVPTGHVFVIFELDGYERHTYDHDSHEPVANFKGAWISGAHDKYLSISAHQDSEMFVIQFKPFGAFPFLHSPMEAMANRVVPVDELTELGLDTLRDSLFSAATSQEKFAVAENWLLSRFDEAKRPPAALLEAIAAIESNPRANLADAIDAFAGTNKHLIELFKRYVGITPKVYQRVLRFNEVFLKIRENGSIDWAEVASDCGYADQSHFIREFRRFSGFRPEEFIQAGVNNDEGNFFPLDREG